jgi:hypothetical protein
VTSDKVINLRKVAKGYFALWAKAVENKQRDDEEFYRRLAIDAENKLLALGERTVGSDDNKE